MFLSNLSHPARWQPFLPNPVFLESLRWINEHAASVAEGIHELGRPGWLVNVHSYSTQARELCTWENHTQTIDLQFMIDGLEGIDLIDVAQLGAPTSFKPDSDTQKFAAPNVPATSLVLATNDFVIFFPGEAHRPKIAPASPGLLKKLVVKIPTALL